MADRCTGHCCKSFNLPFSPTELRERYCNWLCKSGESVVEMGPQDIFLIYPMVRYLGLIKPPHSCFNETEEGHYYTCVHFNRSPDGDGGDCAIYDIRPAMCREYPYGRKCHYKDCTWDEKSRVKNPDPEPSREARQAWSLDTQVTRLIDKV